jgi:Apea-like HEPN
VVAPFSAWTSSLSSYHDDRQPADVALDETDVQALKANCDALAPYAVANIRIAVERTLAAATERVHASDVLIDAVIAWENLVGISSETTFRVTAALSWLLARDDFRKRTDLSRELKRLYERRSKVVHGAKVTRDDLDSDARLALQTSAAALRRLLFDDVWLCEVARSGDRNNAILLGDPHFGRDIPL